MIQTAITLNEWICTNAAKLKERLSLYSSLDEDAFQDAYLTLVTDCEAEEDSMAFEKAFVAAYRKLSGKRISEAYATVHPDDLFFTLLPTQKDEPEEKRDERPSQRLASKIRKHIRATFSTNDVAAFEMKIAGYPCRDITDALGMGTTAVNNATQRIITQTRLQFAAVAL